jgi:hypothetical protein
MKRRKGRKRQLKTKGPRKSNTIAPYSKHVNNTSHQINSSY